MKLREFRKIIDRLDDEAKKQNYYEDEDIMLDISPDKEDENNIDIGDVYKSNLSKNRIKIEPRNTVDRHRPARKTIRDRDIIIDQTNYFCPNCGKRVGKNDHFCRYCGQEMITYQEQERKEQAEERTRHELLKEQHQAYRK